MAHNILFNNAKRCGCWTWLTNIFSKIVTRKNLISLIIFWWVFYLYSIPVFWSGNGFIPYFFSEDYFRNGQYLWIFVQGLATISIIITVYIELRKHREILYIGNYPSILPTTIQRAVACKLLGNKNDAENMSNRLRSTHMFKLEEIERHSSWGMHVFDLTPLKTEEKDYPYFMVQNTGKGIAMDIRMTLCFPSHNDGEELYDFDDKFRTIQEDRVYSLEPNEIFIFYRDQILYRDEFKNHFQSYAETSKGKFAVLLEYKSMISHIDIVEIFEARWRRDSKGYKVNAATAEDKYYYIDDFVMIPKDKWKLSICTKDVIKKLKKNPKFIK